MNDSLFFKRRNFLILLGKLYPLLLLRGDLVMAFDKIQLVRIALPPSSFFNKLRIRILAMPCYLSYSISFSNLFIMSGSLIVFAGTLSACQVIRARLTYYTFTCSRNTNRTMHCSWTGKLHLWNNQRRREMRWLATTLLCTKW